MTPVKKIKIKKEKPASAAAAPKKHKIEKPKEIKKALKYFEEVGRRKTAIARVRLLKEGEKTIVINGKPFENYFQTLELREAALSPLKTTDLIGQFQISVKTKGGGLHAQAEAVRHGIAKALVLFSPELRTKLKKAGYLTRDPRMRERKKFGLKLARRAPQWQKR